MEEGAYRARPPLALVALDRLLPSLREGRDTPRRDHRRRREGPRRRLRLYAEGGDRQLLDFREHLRSSRQGSLLLHPRNQDWRDAPREDAPHGDQKPRQGPVGRHGDLRVDDADSPHVRQDRRSSLAPAQEDCRSQPARQRRLFSRHERRARRLQLDGGEFAADVPGTGDAALLDAGPEPARLHGSQLAGALEMVLGRLGSPSREDERRDDEQGRGDHGERRRKCRANRQGACDVQVRLAGNSLYGPNDGGHVSRLCASRR